MKKILVYIFSLVMIDQIIKLLIARYLINANIVLLPDVLYLRPVQNIHLNWIASILEYNTPVLLMVLYQLFVSTIILLTYRYLSYLWTPGKKYLNGMILFIISGITCSFIDVVFWGGSLDYIRLVDLFTFDLKDVYLDIGIFYLLLYTLVYTTKVYCRMSKTERKETGIWIWIKKGIPAIPTE